MKKIIFLLFSALLITSCSNIEKSSEKKKSIYQSYIEEHKLESLDRIRSFKFYAWRSLDNNNLIISTTHNKPYLVQLKNYCGELRFAHTILINSSSASLQAKFDSIQIADSSSMNQHREKCFIKALYKLSKEQADEIGSLGKKKEVSTE